MNNTFAQKLAVGGKSNSLGLAGEVVQEVLGDKSRLEELYNCLFEEDAWLRMRAADSLEKVCRVHPNWVQPYVEKIQTDFATTTQPSIQWHIAQIYAQVALTDAQKTKVISWLTHQLQAPEVDWIVAANCLQTLADFVRRGDVSRADFTTLLKVQQHHKSNAVRKRVEKLLTEFTQN